MPCEKRRGTVWNTTTFVRRVDVNRVVFQRFGVVPMGGVQRKLRAVDSGKAAPANKVAPTMTHLLNVQWRIRSVKDATITITELLDEPPQD